MFELNSTKHTKFVKIPHFKGLKNFVSILSCGVNIFPFFARPSRIREIPTESVERQGME